jgi:hypothetical protein
MEDLEDELSTLDQYDNHTQLILLNKEIQYMMIYGIQPAESWYQDRIRYVYTYSELGWKNMSTRFHNKDDYLYRQSQLIADMLEALLQEWSTSPEFNRCTYARLLYEMDRLWRYYQTQYVGNETDDKVVDLIEGLTHLMGSKS